MKVDNLGPECQGRAWRDTEGGKWEFWDSEDSWMYTGAHDTLAGPAVPLALFGPYTAA